MPHVFRAGVKKSPFLKCFEKLKVTNPKFRKLMISENLTISKALLILVDVFYLFPKPLTLQRALI